MKKKKIIIISISIFFAILLTIIVLPFIFKDKIIETVKTEINKTINAEVNWDSFSFSLIKSFPDFKLELKKLSVKGINEFRNDTLMFVDNFGFRINLMSVFRGDEYEIKSIDIKEARINAIVLKDGRANWDIVKPSEEIPEEEVEPTKFAVALKNISIKDSYIKYQDDEMDFAMEISGFNHRLRGNLTESVTKIRTKTTAKSVSMIYEGIPYLSKANFSSDFDMDANMDTWRFDFLDNNIKFNELLVNFAGW
ncbi:MAG: AsmA family protein, partial [Bacteroidales bacterium]|nr:AsmA family protein [Bacteroidales bacterium]